MDENLKKTLSSALLASCIEETVINWTKDTDKINPTVKSILKVFAEQAAIKILEANLPFQNFTDSWKLDTANMIESALDTQAFVQEHVPAIVRELPEKYGYTISDFDGFMDLSLNKIAVYAGSIAYMVSHGLDPLLLRMNQEEKRAEMQKIMVAFSEQQPEKLLIIDPNADSPQYIADEIRLRIDPPDISHLFKKT
jgi:hypothetical protein